MIIKEHHVGSSAHMQCYSYEMCTDDGAVVMAHGGMNVVDTRFSENYIPTMAIGGIGTDVQYRRQGCIRTLFDHLLPRAKEYGAIAAMLHPFSFSYYRKFGFERVSDTVIVDFPMTALDHLPRYADLVPMTEARLPEVLALYERCSVRRNLSVRREGGDWFPFGHKKKTFLYEKPDGQLGGYIIVEGENHFDGINRMISDNLHIHELLFEDRSALEHLLSFVRMYEGEFKTVHMHDVGMLPEVDLVLRHYMDTRYDIHPDIMARVLDTEAMLRANTYPQAGGRFVLRVEDTLPDVRGVFCVEYEKGTCAVTRCTDGTAADLTVTAPALSRLLYGCDAYDAGLAAYIEGAVMHNGAEDFFRAFPKRPCGVFHHF